MKIFGLALLVLLVVSCSMLLPGYEQEREALKQITAEAKSAREAAQEQADAARQQAAQAVKDGDAQATALALTNLATKLEGLSKTVSDEIGARSAQAQHEIESAGKAAGTAGVGISEVLTGGGTLLAGALAFFAQAKANKATTTATVAQASVEQQKTAPSRAQGELDDLYDDHNALKKELAETKGQLTALLAAQKAAA